MQVETHLEVDCARLKPFTVKLTVEEQGTAIGVTDKILQELCVSDGKGASSKTMPTATALIR